MSLGQASEWFLKEKDSPDHTQQGPFTATDLVDRFNAGELKGQEKVTAEWLCGEWIDLAELVAGYKSAQGSGSGGSAGNNPNAQGSKTAHPSATEPSLNLSTLSQEPASHSPEPKHEPEAPVVKPREPAQTHLTTHSATTSSGAPIPPFQPPPRPNDLESTGFTGFIQKPDATLSLFEVLQASRQKKARSAEEQNHPHYVPEKSIWEKLPPDAPKWLLMGGAGIIAVGVLWALGSVIFSSSGRTSKKTLEAEVAGAQSTPQQPVSQPQPVAQPISQPPQPSFRATAPSMPSAPPPSAYVPAPQPIYTPPLPPGSQPDGANTFTGDNPINPDGGGDGHNDGQSQEAISKSGNQSESPNDLGTNPPGGIGTSDDPYAPAPIQGQITQ